MKSLLSFFFVLAAPAGSLYAGGPAWLEDAAAVGIQVGAKAPGFSLPDQGGHERSVSSLMGKEGLDGGRVRVETTASDTSAGLGSRLTLGVTLQIPAGWHVYAPQVKGGYHGTSWRMDPSECSIIGDMEYPEPRWEQAAFAAEKLPEYEGTVRFTREVIVKPMISNASTAVWQRFRKSCLQADSSFVSQGSLEFQTCTDRECLPPQSVPLKWKFVFVPPDRQRVPVDDWRVFEH